MGAGRGQEARCWGCVTAHRDSPRTQGKGYDRSEPRSPLGDTGCSAGPTAHQPLPTGTQEQGGQPPPIPPLAMAGSEATPERPLQSRVPHRPGRSERPRGSRVREALTAPDCPALCRREPRVETREDRGGGA